MFTRCFLPKFAAAGERHPERAYCAFAMHTLHYFNPIPGNGAEDPGRTSFLATVTGPSLAYYRGAFALLFPARIENRAGARPNNGCLSISTLYLTKIDSFTG
jgi:hypothetical protein